MDSSEPLYNSRVIDNFLKLLKKRYPNVNVGELLTYAGMKAHEVADQVTGSIRSRWIGFMTNL